MDYIQKASQNIVLRGNTLRSVSTSDQPQQIRYSQTKRINVSRSYLNEHFVITQDTPDFVARAYKVMRIQVMKKMQENS